MNHTQLSFDDVEGHEDSVCPCPDRDAENCLLTTEQAARRVGISHRTMRRIISVRGIRHLRIGRLIRLIEKDVDDFVSRSIVEPVEQS